MANILFSSFCVSTCSLKSQSQKVGQAAIKQKLTENVENSLLKEKNGEERLKNF